MTDNDIIKALECCSKGSYVCGENCPRFDNGKLTIPACRFELLGEALDLINRQKAEIEELRKGFTADMDYFASEYDSKIKSEAIKEFAERFKEKSYLNDGVVYIDNLVKEMVGE